MFTLPEQGGDLPLEEARNIWKDKIIWVNFPTSVMAQGREEAKRFIDNLFKKVSLANSLIMEISENLPHMRWKDIMLMLGEIIPNANHRP